MDKLVFNFFANCFIKMWVFHFKHMGTMCKMSNYIHKMLLNARGTYLGLLDVQAKYMKIKLTISEGCFQCERRETGERSTILRSTGQDKRLVEQFHRPSFFPKNVHAFFHGYLRGGHALFQSVLRMEVQVYGYVWTGKNVVMRLRVDAETFENGKIRVDVA